jgi:tRNA (guanine37-N1)-methyltransferase
VTITILTLFPQVFTDIFSTSILGRAQKKGLVKINLVDIRDFATDKHKSVDDTPYGGGPGMIMRVDIMEKAIAFSKFKKQSSKIKTKERIILLDPAGKRFNQAKAREYAKLDHLILVCGHYEGVDARISHFVDESVSIGEYVLTGGEIPAMVIADSVIRLIPQVLAKKEATIRESYSVGHLLEAPQYTRPREYKGYKVPAVLTSGNHQKIENWQNRQSILRSKNSH